MESAESVERSDAVASQRPLSGPAFRLISSQLVDWYRRPDQFDTFNRYLADKGLTVASRFLVVCSLVLVTVIMFLTRFSPQGPTTPHARTANAVIIVITVMMAVALSTRRNLSRSWSYAFVLYSEVGIAAAMALYSNPLAALAHAVMFSVIGGYIAFFHNARIQSLHMLWVFVVVIGIVTRISVVENYSDVPVLIALTVLVGAAIYVIPFACQFIFSILGTDALNSQLDPLTGLLNRRGLADEVRLLLERSYANSALVVVAAVDIDRFKTINDEYGHTVGDAVIEKVGSRLVECAGPAALIARIGGDEFIIVDSGDQRSVDRLEQELQRSTVTAPDHSEVALSVGIAKVAGPFESPDDALIAYPTLLRRADRAMYAAKARGGHSVVLLTETD
ncbi:sensor domain-containing diguanylate cyclase [Rhodococcus erythropolis]|uniref:GGDEF domain-containing protein n=1 Tax=Rhodococcus erythropolis TaxID=1833 RepID=UPI0022B3799F|nr:GGDEF domain-containing protein [Rhodococcus erythropolis]MCZ4565788.1 GGDEF domain-containing protein [Rhodococcus erythropolis]